MRKLTRTINQNIMADKDKKNKSTGNIVSKIVNHIKASKEKKKINIRLSGNKLSRREADQFQNSLQGMTKEEKIAANKARVAKYHPEPDFSNISSSPQIAKERRRIKRRKAGRFSRSISLINGT